MRLLVAVLACLCAAGAAAALPVRIELVAGGASAPVDIQRPAGDAARLFVVEQGGVVRILRDGALSATPFLDLRALVLSGNERGLLGLAFHPQYATNGRLYVNYTRAPDGATVIASFRVSAGNPDVADLSSRVELLTVAQPFSNHNGGALRFGPDGYLYVGLGDGGSGNDPGNRAQDPQDLLGKMLRLDVDRGTPYAIPPGNVYANGGGRPEIFASGLRNPWRFSFDRVTGDLYIGDVGQDVQEEIDFLPHPLRDGVNFGWRVLEGTRCTGLGGGAPCGAAAYTGPILTYDHGQGCSVTGGVVYRGRAVPVLYGRYLYADYCTGRIWAAARDRDGAWVTEEIAATGHQITTFGEDAAGEVLWANGSTGQVHRLAPDPASPVAIEYYNAALAHYFLTAFPEEAAFLDAGGLAGAWQRTGYAFAAWNADDAGTVDVCRLFGTPDVGPNTHFYTGFAAECAGLRVNPLWTYEGIAFRMRLPAADACPVSTRPVYRLYNDPPTLAEVNHRYTTDGAVYVTMQAQGWIGEGVAFCAK